MGIGPGSLDGYIPPMATYSGPTYASRFGGPAYGGRGPDMVNGQYVPGTDAAEQDVNRFRGMGARPLPTPTINTTQSDQSRALGMRGRNIQMGSLGMLEAGARGTTADMRLLRGAAEGSAPSRAEILGNRMMNRSLASQVSAAGNVRGGPGASAAAYRFGSQNAATQRADLSAGIQAERAAEMGAARRDFAGAAGTARGQYFGGTTDLRGQDLGLRAQDLGLASDQAHLAAGERAAGRQQEQFYEKLASDTRFGVLGAEQNAWRGELGYEMDQRRMRNQEAAADWDRTKDMVSAGAGAVVGAYGAAAGAKAAGAAGGAGRNVPAYYDHSSGIYRGDPYTRSDARAKEPVPMGSLSGLMMSDRNAKEDARLKGQAEGMLAGYHRALEKGPAVGTKQPSYWGGIYREFPTEAPGPDGPGELASTSDERAKYTYSDERTKGDVPFTMSAEIDAKQREGRRDPKTVTHDTPEDQARTKRAYEDKAGHDADDYIAAMRASLGKGPSLVRDEGELDEPMADAMRSMQAQPYIYKPEFRPADQAPGEINVGPMANNMARDPVARTAIVKEPNTGMLAIDKDKASKVMMGSLAALQHQIDQLKGGR